MVKIIEGKKSVPVLKSSAPIAKKSSVPVVKGTTKPAEPAKKPKVEESVVSKPVVESKKEKTPAPALQTAEAPKEKKAKKEKKEAVETDASDKTINSKKDKGLDSLFAKIKKAKEKAKQEKIQLIEDANAKAKNPKSLDEDLGLNTKERQYTEEGWAVYTPEELKLGQGGDTPDCPFDCWCCY